MSAFKRFLLSLFFVKSSEGQLGCPDPEEKKYCENKLGEDLQACQLDCGVFDYVCRRNCLRQYSSDLDGKAFIRKLSIILLNLVLYLSTILQTADVLYT